MSGDRMGMNDPDTHRNDAAQRAWVRHETEVDDRTSFMAGWDAAVGAYYAFSTQSPSAYSTGYTFATGGNDVTPARGGFRRFDYDAEEGWIVENDGEGASQIVAKSVLPSFGRWIEAVHEAIVIEMENEGVVTWGDPRHRARFLAALREAK